MKMNNYEELMSMVTFIEMIIALVLAMAWAITTPSLELMGIVGGIFILAKFAVDEVVTRRYYAEEEES